MIDQDLVAYIVALDTDASTRVYTGNAPQNATYPLIVVRRTGGSHPRTMWAPLFERSEFAVHIITDNYAEAYPIANEIRDALKEFRGKMENTEVVSAKCTLFPTDQSEIEFPLPANLLRQDKHGDTGQNLSGNARQRGLESIYLLFCSIKRRYSLAI